MAPKKEISAEAVQRKGAGAIIKNMTKSELEARIADVKTLLRTNNYVSRKPGGLKTSQAWEIFDMVYDAHTGEEIYCTFLCTLCGDVVLKDITNGTHMLRNHRCRSALDNQPDLKPLQSVSPIHTSTPISSPQKGSPNVQSSLPNATASLLPLEFIATSSLLFDSNSVPSTSKNHVVVSNLTADDFRRSLAKSHAAMFDIAQQYGSIEEGEIYNLLPDIQNW